MEEIMYTFWKTYGNGGWALFLSSKMVFQLESSLYVNGNEHLIVPKCRWKKSFIRLGHLQGYNNGGFQNGG